MLGNTQVINIRLEYKINLNFSRQSKLAVEDFDPYRLTALF